MGYADLIVDLRGAVETYAYVYVHQRNGSGPIVGQKRPVSLKIQ